LAGAFAGLLCSCSSDDGEVKSSENYIEKFVINGINPIEIIIKDDQRLIYVYTYPENYDKLITTVPDTIKISEKAVLSDNGKIWHEEGFLYTVTAENGEERNYSVDIDITIPKRYSFETWEATKGYYTPSGLNSRWTSGNAGISMALNLLGKDPKNPKNYPTRDTTDIYGNAVLLETIEGGMIDFMNKNIPLFSGNFILGNFNIAKIYSNELLATEVGRTYPAKPKSIKGYYKYTEGPGDFRDSSGTPYPGRNDSCSMNAIFYQSDKDTIITVVDMDTSSLVIARASLQDCSQTIGDGFHEFEVSFNYESEPDFESHSYKLGITFAASKYGDKYAGKIGTKLIIDEIEIIDD